MEDVALDHNMEMIPDVHGPVDNHDDIEIDLDFDDGAADRDGDVVVDDASVTASDHPAEAGQEFLDDADMMDGENGQGDVADSDFTYYQEDQYQYFEDGGHQESHDEAEMEDDYEEDIDAPIPGTGTLDFQVSDAKETRLQPEPTSDELPKSPAHGPDRSPKHSVADEEIPQDHSTTLAADAIEEKGEEEKRESVQGDDYGHANVEESHEAPSLQEQPEEPIDTKEQDKVYDHTEGDEVQQEAVEQESKEASNEVNLHNIKILYQESEISLFPPMEDDPSETYFLEDTAIAHEPVSKLFEACRLVLDDYVSEEEELILDVDPLNLHISQTSNQNSSITLFQIYQLYHNLCHNDGVDSPEPLYLSLSSSNTFDALINRLLHAVEEGKGLSSIETWDVYEQDEAELGSPVAEEDTDTLNAADGSYAQETRPEGTELGDKEPEPAEEDAVDIYQSGQLKEDVTLQDSPSHPVGDYGTPTHGQDKENVAPASPGEDGHPREHPPENPQDVQETEELYNTEIVDQTYPDDEEYNDTGEHYAESHEEVSGPGDIGQEGAFPEEPSDTENPGLQRNVSQLPKELAAAGDVPLESEAGKAAEAGWQPAVSSSQQAETSHSPARASADDDRGDDAVILVHETEIHQDGITTGADKAVEFQDDHVPDNRGDGPEIDEGEAGVEDEFHAAHDRPPGVPDVGLEVQGATSAPAPNDFDIQEDFLDDQVAEDAAPLASVDDSVASRVVHEQNFDPTEPGLANGSSYADPSELESGEVSPYEAKAVQPENEKSFVEESPISGKRPRTDDIDTAEEAVPDIKRRRSD